MMKQARALEGTLSAPKGEDAYEAAHYYRYTVFDIMRQAIFQAQHTGDFANRE